jgi:hypothetical protein
MEVAIFLTAIATVAIAAFTFFLCRYNKKLWEATEKLWKTTAESIELTQQEFITSHPPRLRVHSVSLERGSIEAGGGGSPCKIQFFIDNIGGSPATVKKSNLAFKMLDENPLPARLPFDNESHTLSVKYIDRGEAGNPPSINEKLSPAQLHQTAIPPLQPFELSPRYLLYLAVPEDSRWPRDRIEAEQRLRIATAAVFFSCVTETRRICPGDQHSFHGSV